jgi:hypothetical protein
MDAGPVTTARTVIRPPQLRQRFTSTSNVLRFTSAQSARERGA